MQFQIPLTPITLIIVVVLLIGFLLAWFNASHNAKKQKQIQAEAAADSREYLERAEALLCRQEALIAREEALVSRLEVWLAVESNIAPGEPDLKRRIVS
jgi:sensor histidine kinase regulating citrate/malate metabolism